MADVPIVIRGLQKRYGDRGVAVQALVDVDLVLQAGEFVSLVGPSGCGKSTLLRIVAGIVQPSEGEVLVLGQSAEQARRQRAVSFVFQNPVMLPWRKTIDNVGFALEVLGAPRRNREARARDAMALVGLQGFEQALPDQLSGGMRQRAALARALTLQPRVLLMDEPFGALDELTRERLNVELLRVLAGSPAAVLLVTHSIEEAVLLSDRIIVMTPRPGRIGAEIPIDLPRPRLPTLRQTPAFVAYAARVRELLYAYELAAEERPSGALAGA
jgi:NitT/TauT family transport system ATP-binding protein